MINFAACADHLTNALVPQWFDSALTAINPSNTGIGAGLGRNGVNSFHISTANGGTTYAKVLPSARATQFMCAAYKGSGAGTVAVTNCVMAMTDASTIQVGVMVGSDGTLYFLRGNSSTPVAQSGPGAVPVGGAYPHIAWKATIHNTAGKVSARVNNVPVELFISGVSQGFEAINLNTRVSVNNQLTVVQWGIPNGTTACDVCDLITWDETGSFNTTWLGDKKVRVFAPTGNGTTIQATIGGTSPAASAYQSVNEATADDGVTVNVYGSAPLKNTYTWAGAPSTAAGIVALIPFVRAAKDDAGTNTIHTVVRGTAGTEVESADKTLTTNYGYFFDVRETDPETGALWTQAGTVGTEIGTKRVA